MIHILYGPSGAGKTHQKRLYKLQGWIELISYTTRNKRSDEANNIDYHFVGGQEWNDLVISNKLTNVNAFCGEWYGIDKIELLSLAKDPNNNIVVISDLSTINKSKGEQDFLLFLDNNKIEYQLVYCRAPNDKDVLWKRLLDRNTADRYIVARQEVIDHEEFYQNNKHKIMVIQS